METQEWTFLDKTTWGEGPWQTEPDKIQWTDKETGFPCLIVRGFSGGLCGYVGVPREHPWHGKDYNELHNVPVHGGLTFAGACQEHRREQGICHVPAPGESDDVWWLGFDCNHYDDFSPELQALVPARWQDVTRYKTVEYVKIEIRDLAKMAAGVIVLHPTNEVAG